MIDLHLHTTASDGRTPPSGLVAEARSAGLRTIAVTDHDTMAGVPEVVDAARDTDVTVIPGIEITAVHDGRDVHVLGYYLDAQCDELLTFLAAQRAERRRRLTDILAVLDRLGLAIDAAPLVERTVGDNGRAVGRPLVAQALVEAGHARDISDAFARFLGEGRPAFVPRSGASPSDVIALIARAGGFASLAHPGKTAIDPLIASLAAAGLEAIEVYHPDHDATKVARYRGMATRHDLMVTGGSDYHGAGSGRETALGKATLPVADFARVEARGFRAGAAERP